MHGDELVKKMVEEVLYQHMDNADTGISVHVEKGFVNILGVVDVLAEKYMAQKLVQGVPGVKGVDNSLTISTDGKIADDDINRSIEDLLGKHPRLKERGIGSSCHRGNVHLRGKVRTLAESDETEEIARKVMGVKEVINDLKVDRNLKGPVDDASLVNYVEGALAASREVEAQDVKTVCRDGIVYLEGEVDTLREKEAAYYWATTVPGVRKVVSHLQIRYGAHESIKH